MKNLLASTAIALVAMAGAASAQSVLERVLGSIEDIPNASTVNGTFANIAENIGVLAGEPINTYADGDTVINQDQYDAILAARIEDAIVGLDPVDDADAIATAIAAVNAAMADQYAFAGVVAGPAAILNKIDGSISNTMEGIAAATASNGSVFAINEVTVDIGDLTTTVLGAVNTGDIALGANMNVSEAVAGASQAIHGTIDQIGGSVDTAALVLNVASNSTAVLGNVNNQFASLNGSIGNVATTVLGAVNTGTITNGLNASINGTISDLVGASNN